MKNLTNPEYALLLQSRNKIMHKNATTQEMKEFPHLVTKDKNGNLVFKTPPNFAERMREHRLKFYHIYRFTSFFTHPTPDLLILLSICLLASNFLLFFFFIELAPAG